MRVPVATYRIQFQPGFGFAEAAETVSYLAELGISHLYASPVFKAKKGSRHGYDVVDPTRINPDLGSEADFEALVGLLRDQNMGYIQDIVPNHMAFDFENGMLMDVLENGTGSPYRDHFDIEWEHPYAGLRGRLLAPFLGRFFGEALESAEIRLRYEKRGFMLRYFDLAFPLRLESYPRLLTPGLDRLKKELGDDHIDFIRMLGVLYVLKALAEGGERGDQARFVKATLWDMHEKNPAVARFMEESTARFNAEEGDAGAWTDLEDLLSEQLYRLCFWKTATEEINYRRFFNVNDLICVRVENEAVFRETHALLFRLLDEGMIDGIRIDHVDGLYDPVRYLNRLRDRAGDAYVLVEKILEKGERLPDSWPVEGTTGYDSLNMLNGIFCDRRNQRVFTGIYHRFIGTRADYDRLLYDKKKLILQKEMAGDIDNLANLLKGISGRDRHAADITLHGVRESLVEIMSHFPVYRTYVGEGPVRDADAARIKSAVAGARRMNPRLHHELDFIERFLLLQYEDYLPEDEKGLWIRFGRRFQQFTGPLMAKGFEDTLLYVYNRLLSLNEVGGDPRSFGTSLEDFHGYHEKRGVQWPHTMNATTTHDCKRGEDVRPRIHVLTEIPGEWEAHLKHWNRINRKKKERVKGFRVPDRNDEYFLYQTIIGACPARVPPDSAFAERVREYVVKAVREAKVHTAWLRPDREYEQAYLVFVDRLLHVDPNNAFLEDFLPFQRRVAFYGLFSALSQTLIKITLPGVPDFYQGTEFWDLTLVDPDNRRPVDFRRRKEVLDDIRTRMKTSMSGLLRDLLRRKEDGRIKLFLIHRALAARNHRAGLFRDGQYDPLTVTGRFRDHVVAFSRRRTEACAVTIAPRFLTGLIREGDMPLGTKIWDDTRVTLPGGGNRIWHNTLTGRTVRGESSFLLGDILEDFPVALLIS
jgi:(1->4)-alpha-D-glucan 1-alpha-D-glucosylmutase